MRHSTVAVIAGLVLALTACGSPSDDQDGVATLDTSAAPDGSTSEAAEVDPQTAMLEFAQCMRDNGVDMPDPEVDEDGRIAVRANAVGDMPDPDVLEEAQAACGDLLAGAIGDRPVEIDAERQQQMLDFASCMRDEGIDWPDPQFDGGGMAMELPQDLDSGELQAAQEVCSEHLGDGPFMGAARPDDGAGS